MITFASLTDGQIKVTDTATGTTQYFPRTLTAEPNTTRNTLQLVDILTGKVVREYAYSSGNITPASANLVALCDILNADPYFTGSGGGTGGGWNPADYTLIHTPGNANTSGASEDLVAANPDRKAFFFKNNGLSGIWVNVDGTPAVVGSGILVDAGASLFLTEANCDVSKGVISCIGTAAGIAYYFRESSV